MDHFDEKIDELLAKHLAAESSPEEEEVIRRWLDESAENRQHLDELSWLWENSAAGLTAPSRAVDTETALRQVRQKMHTGGGRVVPMGQSRGWWYRAAAAILILAVAAVYWWQTANAPEPVRIATAETILTDTLTDGSVITLQQHSGLTLNTNFNRRERRMRLQGEAYFEVAPDTVRPFVVEVQELEVQVVGTAFTVDNFSDAGKVIVTVTEGKVRVSKGSQTLLLGPGEQATYVLASGELLKTTPEQGTPVFKNRVFRFDATPLRDVALQISKAYGVEILIKNKQLETCPLTARYNNLPLERVLNLVSESFSIKFEKSANGYVLSGEGCE